MESAYTQYQDQMLKEFERQKEIRLKNVAFVNARFYALKNAYETIHMMIPGVIIYNLSFHVINSANGRLVDEYYFDAMYPFQDVQFTVSFKKGRYDTLKVVPFFKMQDLKCPFLNVNGGSVKYYVSAEPLLVEPVNIMKFHWGFE
jgi:hypothetical protein